MDIRTDTAIISQDLETLAGEVENYDQGSAGRLRNLADAVSGGPSAPAWASVEIRQLIAPDAISEYIRQRKSADSLVNMLELTRNALVFLPIVITWFGIAVAVEAYYRLLERRPNLNQQTFLFLWQGGFEGELQPAWLTLSNLGLIVGALLLLVFLMTVFVLWRGGTNNANQERRTDRLSQRLEHVLAEATLVLRLRYTNQQGVLATQVEQLGRQLLIQLGEERARIAKLGGQRQRELADFTTFTGDLKQSTTSLVTSAGTLEQSYKSLASSINNLVAPTQQMATFTGKLLGAAQGVATPLLSLVEQQRELGQRLSNAAGSLSTSATSVVGAAKSTAGLADQILAAQTQFLEGASADRASQQRAAQSLNETATRLEAAAQLVNKAYDALSGSIATLTAPTQGLAQEAGVLAATARASLSPLRELADQQQAVVSQIRDISDKLTYSGADVAAASREIAAIADNLLGAQSEFLQALAREREAQTRMAQLVSQSAGNLDQVAVLFRELGPALKAIALDLAYLTSTRPAQP